MTTLNVNGKQVSVDDSFLKLTPEQQSSTVDEISKSMGPSSSAPSSASGFVTPKGFVPGQAPTPDQMKVLQGNWGKTISGVAPPEAGQPQDPLPAPIRAFGENVVNSVPIAGPLFMKGLAATETPDQQATAAKWSDQANQAAPGAALTGQVVGTVAPFVAGGEIPLVAKGLGLTGGLVSRTVLGGATNAAISAADTALRGGDQGQIGGNAAISGAVGAILPGAGELVQRVGQQTIGKAVGTLRSLMNPDASAQGALGSAMRADAQNVGQPILSQADQTAALGNNQPLLNIDRSGANVRALGRAASNSNADARAEFTNVSNDRFQAQGDRATSFIDRLMGGNVNDLQYQAQKQAEARMANDVNYQTANEAPEAQSIFTPKIQQLMQSPSFLSAVKSAESTSADVAAAQGGQAVKNPFVFDANGVPSLKPGVTPSLQFWNAVKINLDGKIGMAQRAGDNATASTLTQIKKQLVGGLDEAVPAYQTARQGAAAAFGADDALTAGQNFVTQSKGLRQAAADIAKFTPSEREAFGVGFASQLKEQISKLGDSRDLTLSSIWNSPAAKNKIRLALGDDRANDFEQFMRVESTMNGLRKMLSGSDTAQKLAELGIIGGVGGAVGLETGDWKQGLGTAALLKGGKMAGEYANRQMMSRIAQILVSDDPNAMAQATKLAASDPKAAEALKQLGKIVSTGIRGAAVTVPAMALGQSQQAAQP